MVVVVARPGDRTGVFFTVLCTVGLVSAKAGHERACSEVRVEGNDGGDAPGQCTTADERLHTENINAPERCSGFEHNTTRLTIGIKSLTGARKANSAVWWLSGGYFFSGSSAFAATERMNLNSKWATSILLVIIAIALLVGHASALSSPSMMAGGAADAGSTSPRSSIGTLRIHGPDSNGIVAAFAQTLYGHGCGIVASEQHTDHEQNKFFQRINFDFGRMFTDRITLQNGINEVCKRFGMESMLEWGQKRKKVALMVSKYDHCLWEVLLRHQANELVCDIPIIVSNHPDLKPIADSFKIPFHVFKVTKENKDEVESEQLALFKEHDIDVVVLARYMQIISDKFCEAYPVINIHHSFLPAFIGGRPYHRAHERGVKLIGATAHYATADLDEGPIIEQDIVLVHALKAHVEDRIIVYNNRCVVFEG
jgi:formyltetrahydrofolate deformylase